MNLHTVISKGRENRLAVLSARSNEGKSGLYKVVSVFGSALFVAVMGLHAAGLGNIAVIVSIFTLVCLFGYDAIANKRFYGGIQ